ncbi:hypothetical protein ACJVDH_11885 [Pedobacter sp. AW1-32]|uniref:hypothetical protein n=1 Tax=Pedobacter sp. AW1-32 TaxID=3383026 RepID=UPI003FF0DDD1
MNKLLSAEDILFECLSELSAKSANTEIEVGKDINEAVLKAMQKHTAQYLVRVDRFLQRLSKLTIKDPSIKIPDLKSIRKMIAQHL